MNDLQMGYFRLRLGPLPAPCAWSVFQWVVGSGMPLVGVAAGGGSVRGGG
jgi:hypothetical protein